MKRAISIVLIAIMLLQITAVVFAAENATYKISENSSKNLPQKATPKMAPPAPPANHSNPKATSGFEATFAAVGFLAVSFVVLRRRI